MRGNRHDDCWKTFDHYTLGFIVNPGIKKLEDRNFDKRAAAYMCF